VQEQEEILFIGNLRGEWRQVPMKVIPTKLMDRMPKTKLSLTNRVKVLEVDEQGEQETQVFAMSVASRDICEPPSVSVRCAW
jgi:hypothetical protein